VYDKLLKPRQSFRITLYYIFNPNIETMDLQIVKEEKSQTQILKYSVAKIQKF